MYLTVHRVCYQWSSSYVSFLWCDNMLWNIVWQCLLKHCFYWGSTYISILFYFLIFYSFYSVSLAVHFLREKGNNLSIKKRQKEINMRKTDNNHIQKWGGLFVLRTYNTETIKCPWLTQNSCKIEFTLQVRSFGIIVFKKSAHTIHWKPTVHRCYIIQCKCKWYLRS